MRSCQTADLRPSRRRGCPIRRLRVHRLPAAPPERFAARRVLLRPSAPRHPPRTLLACAPSYDTEAQRSLLALSRCTRPADMLSAFQALSKIEASITNAIQLSRCIISVALQPTPQSSVTRPVLSPLLLGGRKSRSARTTAHLSGHQALQPSPVGRVSATSRPLILFPGSTTGTVGLGRIACGVFKYSTPGVACQEGTGTRSSNWVTGSGRASCASVRMADDSFVDPCTSLIVASPTY